MDYNINDFTKRLRELMESYFPYEDDSINEKKHKNRLGHIKQVAFKDNPTETLSENMLAFNIGNAKSESEYPYYHILENAPVIKKKGRATKESRGSQQYVYPMSKRDYEKVTLKGKTFSKEYVKNIRGARKRVVENSTQYVKIGNKTFKINKNADSYKNVHYQYIEIMLSHIVNTLSSEFRMKIKFSSSGLKDDYVNDLLRGGDESYDNSMNFVNQLLSM